MNGKYKAFNTNTGKFYNLEDGCFSRDCQHEGTTLDAGQRAVVKATFYHVGFVTARNGVEWPNCQCSKCQSDANPVKLPPPASPLFRIGCYLPAGEAYPVLVVIARNGLNLGPVHRKGELGYKALLEILETNPELFTPMYYQTAETLKAFLS